MRRFALALGCWLALASVAEAQPGIFQRTSGSITAAASTCTSTACVQIADVTRTSNGTIVLSGTWAATVQFEGSLDGSTWFALNVLPNGSNAYVTSATANGQWIIPIALARLRVRASAYTSGTVSVALLVTSARMNRVPGIDGTTIYPNILCEDATNRDSGIERLSAGVLGVTNCAGSAKSLNAVGIGVGATAPLTGITMADQTDIRAAAGAMLRVNNEASTAAMAGMRFLPSAATLAPSTTVNQSLVTIQTTYAPTANAPNFAMLHLNPTINGTSSGTAVPFVVASKTNILTGGTVLLADIGTTTTDYFTGYTSVFRVGTTGVAVGGGTTLTKVVVYTPSLTPAQLAAAVGVTEQTFTVTGLTTADTLIVKGPAPTALCPPVTYRVSAADTLAIGFLDLTAALCTPAAGTYNIVAIRS